MPVIDDATDALEIIKTHLETQYAGAYASGFSKWGGVDVVVLQELGSALPDQPARPRILLTCESDQESEDWGLFMRDARVRAVLQSTGFTGALAGAANTAPSATLLSRTFADAIHTGYVALEELGILDIEVTGPGQRNRKAKAATVAENTHALTFHYQYRAETPL